MLKVGLLGAGRIGAVHAVAINAHSQSQLVAVSDVVTENARKLAEQYGCRRVRHKAKRFFARSRLIFLLLELAIVWRQQKQEAFQ